MKDDNNYCYYTRLTTSSMGYGYVFLCRYRTELSGSEESPQSSQAADKDATSSEQSAKQQPDSEQQNASSSDNTPR